MAYAGIDDAVDKCSGGNNGNPQGFHCYKWDLLDAGAAPGAASINNFYSLWQLVGVPSHGAVPGAANIPTRATAGSLAQVNASGGRQLWLNYINSWILGNAGCLFIADRLGHQSGLSGVVASPTAQAVNLTAGRYTGAESFGNEIWLEIYQPVGAAATTVAASYTNENGTPGQITPDVRIGGVGFSEGQMLIRLPLASGDGGVLSVESVTLGATTGTAGDFGVTIARTLAMIEADAIRQPQQRNLLGPDFPPVPVKDDACLFYYWSGNPPGTIASSVLFTEA